MDHKEIRNQTIDEIIDKVEQLKGLSGKMSMAEWSPKMIRLLNDFRDQNVQRPIIQELISDQTKNLIQMREDQIIEALRELGYKLDTYEEKVEFAKNRCTILRFPDRMTQLAVDGQPVLQWSEEININHSGTVMKTTIG